MRLASEQIQKRQVALSKARLIFVMVIAAAAAASADVATTASEQRQLRHKSANPSLPFKRPASAKPPKFAKPIGNVTAVAGREARLICIVDNLGAHQVAWLKLEPKTVISIDTNIIITNYRIFLMLDEEERKWVLHIRDVQVSDRGFYQCQVNTQPMMSTSGHLEVVVPPTLVESHTSQIVEVEEFGNVSAQCKFNGQPKPSVSWRRDDGLPVKLVGSKGVVGVAEGHSQFASSAGLTKPTTTTATAAAGDANSNALVLDEVRSERLALSSVDRSMSGIYIKTEKNGIPPIAAKRIPIYVKFKPKVFVQNKFVSVSIGDALSIECFIEAFPRADSFWSKSDRSKHYHSQAAACSLSSSSSNDSPAEAPTGATSDDRNTAVSVKQTAVNAYTYKLTLSVSKVQRSDLGKYACLASNSMGAAEAYVLVTAADLSTAALASADTESETVPVAGNAGNANTGFRQLPNKSDHQRPAAESRRPNSNNNNRVVYDQNYLQAIKTRQSLLDATADGSLTTQQRLKLKQRNGGCARAEWAPQEALLLLPAVLSLIIEAAFVFREQNQL